MLLYNLSAGGKISYDPFDAQLRFSKLFGKLDELFGPLWYSKRFAVRSSAVGEDSEEMSAAGQMTTFLGMKGERKISKAVVECWASQFALTGTVTSRVARRFSKVFSSPLDFGDEIWEISSNNALSRLKPSTTNASTVNR